MLALAMSVLPAHAIAADSGNSQEFKSGRSVEMPAPPRKAPAIGPDGKLHNWQPATKEIYRKNEEGKWDLSSKDVLTYDARGNCIRCVGTEGDGSLSYDETYTYDENDRCISTLSYGKVGTSENDFYYCYFLYDYQYDDITGQQISYTERRRMSEDDPWVTYYINRETVTRDAEHGNRVTQLEDYSYTYYVYNGEEHKSDFTTYTYFRYNDDSVKPYEIESVFTNGNSSDSKKWTNLEWLCCDGQFVNFDSYDLQAASYYGNCYYRPEPRNLAKKFTYSSEFQKGTYDCTPDFDGEGGYSARVEIWNNYTGSWVSDAVYYDMVTFPEMAGYDWFIERSREYEGATTVDLRCGFDSHGNILLKDEGSMEKYVFEYDYNAENGYVEREYGKAELKYSGATRVLEYLAVFSGYKDYAQESRVENVAIDDDAPEVYYNLQGIRVDNPSSGIFIRSKGSRSEVVRLK